MLLYNSGHFFEGAGGKGTYIAWLVSHNSAALLADWMRFVGVPNPTPENELHATVMYCTGKSLGEDMHGDRRLAMPFAETSTGSLRKTSVLGKSKDDSSLVVELGSARPMHQRHEFYSSYHGLTHSYPEYRPHVTLTNNLKACSPELLRRLFNNPCQLPIHFDRERICKT